MTAMTVIIIIISSSTEERPRTSCIRTSSAGMRRGKKMGNNARHVLDTTPGQLCVFRSSATGATGGQSWRSPFRRLTLSAAADHRTGRFGTERVEKVKGKEGWYAERNGWRCSPGLPLTTQVPVVQLGADVGFHVHACRMRGTPPSPARAT
jgi:hypothetical protein